jgi:hypothetical protein
MRRTVASSRGFRITSTATNFDVSWSPVWGRFIAQSVRLRHFVLGKTERYDEETPNSGFPYN